MKGVHIQLHPESGPFSLTELHQFLTQTLDERFLFLRLQDQQQGHDAVHHALHIYVHKRQKRMSSITPSAKSVEKAFHVLEKHKIPKKLKSVIRIE